MAWTVKQKAYLNNATHRWNIKCGATRSGKTYLDYFIIPKRIRAVADRDGLVFMLGNTKGTLQRNVIEPMQKIWGTGFVGDIKSDNTAMLFGEKVHCLGADKINQVDRVRGSSVKYCYGDEIVSWHEEVFGMLKSRLDKPYSLFDGTCNPGAPSHWLKEFIDSDADVFYQQYSIYDNEFLDPTVRAEMEKEHTGVFFTRYILGEWVRAEGAIYVPFADDPARYYTHSKDIPRLMEVNAAFDPGGTQSKHAFVATGITPNYQKLIALRSERHKAEGTTPKDVDKLAVEFVGKVIAKYGRCDYLYWDNEAAVLGRGIQEAVEKVYPQVSVRPCYKGFIRDRIDLICRLLGLDRFMYTEDCETLKEALEQAVWDDKHDDERLDDGSTPIDDLDAFEYCWSNQMKRFIF